MDEIVKPRPRLAAAPASPSRRPGREEAEAAVRTLIARAGDDPDCGGPRDTPRRAARAYTATTQFGGVFRDDPNEQTRFFDLPRGGRRS